MQFWRLSTGTALAQILRWISALLLISFFCSSLVSAIPTPAGKSKPIPTLDECRKLVKVPKDKALLWSQVNGKQYEFANAMGLTTDEAAYPHGFTELAMQLPAKQGQEFADDFSQAFAEAASGTVYVMIPWDKPFDRSRVFGRVEEPALMRNRKVTQIIQVNPDNFKQTRPYNPKIKSHLRR
ncbi:MAG: hypothetical protein MMC33_003149 [Icmadophila ericetorum]|nr:hypothetical protein [Icmadophila ericetorum]